MSVASDIIYVNLRLLEGRQFPALDPHLQLLVGASLSGESIQFETPIEVVGGQADFNVDLVWSLSANNFKVLRSRRDSIKLEIRLLDCKTQVNGIFGTQVIDLREAIQAESVGQVRNASWKRLLHLHPMAAKTNPRFRCILFISKESEDTVQLCRRVSVIPEDSTSQLSVRDDSHYCPDDLEPKLVDNYFILGREAPSADSGAKLYYFCICITFAVHLDQLFLDVINDREAKFYFYYNLFGVDMRTVKFNLLSISGFPAERIVVKIFATSQQLQTFFTKYMKPLTVELRNGKDCYAQAEVDISSLLKISTERLDSGDMLSFDGTIPLKACGKSKLPTQGAADPQIGLLVSLGTKKDIDANDCHLSVSSNVLLSENYENSNGDDVADQRYVSTARKRPADSSEELVNQAKKLFIDSLHKFKLTIDMKRVQLLSHVPCHCVIKYKFKTLTDKELSSAPPFLISEATCWTPIERGVCEFRFVAKESTLKKLFEQRKIQFKIFDWPQGVQKEEVALGSGSMDIRHIMYSSEAMDGRIEATVPLYDKSYRMLALLACEVLLENEDVAENETIRSTEKTLNSFTAPSLCSPIKQATFPSAPDQFCQGPKCTVQQRNSDLDAWKEEQTKLFLNQLEMLEKHHINNLSAEWQRREKERLNEMRTRIQHIKQLEAELRQEAKALKEKQAQLDTRETQLLSRRQEMNQRDDRVQKLMTANARMQGKIKELERQIEHLKSVNTNLENRLADAKKTELLLAQMREQLEASNKAQEYFKEMWQAADKELHSWKEEELKLARQRSQNLSVKLDQCLDKLYSSPFNATSPHSVATEPVDNLEYGKQDLSKQPSAASNAAALQLEQLEHRRSLLLKTGVYNEQDPLLLHLSHQIHCMRQHGRISQSKAGSSQ